MALRYMLLKFGLSPRMLLLPPDQTLAPLSSLTLSSSPLLEISTLSSLAVTLSPDQSFKSLPLDALGQSSRSCKIESAHVSTVDIAPLSSQSRDTAKRAHFTPFDAIAMTSRTRDVRFGFIPLEIAPAPANINLAPSPRCSSYSPSSLPLALGDLELDFPPTPSSVVEIVIQSSPQSSESESSLYESFPILPVPLDASITAHSTPLDVIATTAQTRISTSPAGLRTLINVRFHHYGSPQRLNDPFYHVRKFQSKIKDFGNSQIGTLNTSSRDVFAQQPRLGQLTHRTSRLVFDPGGSISHQTLHEDLVTLASASRRHNGTAGALHTRPQPFPATPRSPKLTGDSQIFSGEDN
ncbi:hypothetical protein EDB85DRAFT_2297773 [Lactarius pseudohatsudake]|nr:hypothetical protein EDB85DRAFT_2297773 [Lactarius pseudohatsudake]